MIISATALLLLSSSQNAKSIRTPVAPEAIRCAPVKIAAGRTGRIVFFGDSITANWAKQAAYTRNVTWVNRGSGGDTAQNARWRLCRDVVAESPAVAHVMFGTNDIAGNAGYQSVERIRDYLVQIVATLQTHHVKVVLGSVLPADQFPWNKGQQPAQRIVQLNNMIRAYALRHCVPYADYWSVMTTTSGGLKPGFTNDGVHPNSAGYAVMQPIAEKAIDAATGRCSVPHG
jgi:lysophospholipase L1-like esterase